MRYSYEYKRKCVELYREGRTAGSSISPRRFLERVLKPNGASRSMMNSTGVSNSTDAAKARI